MARYGWSVLLVGVFFCCGCNGPVCRQPCAISPDKKIIIFSGHTTMQSVMTNYEMVSGNPFDGRVTIVQPTGQMAKTHNFFADIFWSDTRVAPERFDGEIALAKKVKERGSPELFLRLDVTPGNFDWFDDKTWEAMVEKFAMTAKVAKAGDFPGICLDTEQYQYKPFAYWSHFLSGQKTFDEYQSQARLRGRQLAEAVKPIYQDIKIFLTFGNWMLKNQVDAGLSQDKSTFGLLPAFLDGLLDGSEELTIIDGYEDAYPYRRYEQFVEGKRKIREAAKFSVDPKRYNKRVQACFGLWIAYGGTWDKEDFDKNYFTPEEFEHSLHYALLLADQYVWVYGGGAKLWANGTLPKEYADAIINARKPHRLDYEFRDVDDPTTRKTPPPDKKVSARGRGDVKDEYVFQRLWSGYVPVADMPRKGWKFKEDPEDLGWKEKWYRKDIDDSKWGDIEIADWWEAFDYLYTGVAWYRYDWKVPDEAGKYEKLFLAFGAVDEDCWVYIDGKEVYSFIHGGNGWQTPFEIDVSKYIKPGQRHTLAVRVIDTAGPGGIWKSVKLIAPK
ncbi:MAG: hypothetical protein ABIG61_16550 [Planctomycetota bacterium]